MNTSFSLTDEEIFENIQIDSESEDNQNLNPDDQSEANRNIYGL